MKTKIKLTFITLLSVILMGFSTSFLNLVNLGTDPFTYMNLKISDFFGFSFGNWQVILNILLFIPVIIWARDQIGIGTIFNMVLVGYCVEFFSWILLKFHFDALLQSLFARCLVMVPALIVFIFAAATYMATGLGTAPYDAVPFLLSKKIKALPFKWLRLICDFTAIAIGFAFSRKIGIVTILMALFMGQAVAFVSNTFMKKQAP